MSAAKIGLLSLTYLALWWGLVYLAFPKIWLQRICPSCCMAHYWGRHYSLSLLHLTRQRPDLDGGIMHGKDLEISSGFARRGVMYHHWYCRLCGHCLFRRWPDSKDHIIFGEGNTLYSLQAFLYGWCIG